MADALITAKELQDMCEQLDSQHRDQDRLRIIKRAVSSFSFTCNDVAELIKVQRYGDSATQTAILCYPKTQDKAQYLAVVVAALKYQEEKDKVKKELNL